MKREQILCFGDSNTYGLIPGTTDRYPADVRWTGRVAEKLKSYGYKVSEEGLCGRTTVFEDPLREGRRGVSLLPTILETHSPLKMVVLMLGTNDCKTVYDASPDVIGKGIKRLIEQVQRADKDIEVLVVSPIFLGKDVGEEGYDPEFDAASEERSKRLPEVYKKIAEEAGCYFLAASDYAKPSVADREHMDETGHATLAEAISNKIIGVLTKEY